MRSLILIAVLSLISCTENQRARQFGGVAHIDVTAGQKVVGATWKAADLWVLTRPMRADETPETFTLHESSNFGVMEGSVVLKEHASK